MSYEIVSFLDIAVKFWLLAIVVGLPIGIILAMVETVAAAPESLVYNHEEQVEEDQVSVYEEQVEEDDNIYSIHVEEEKVEGDILEDYEAEKFVIVLELLELAGFDVRTSGPGFEGMMILTLEELEDLWETTVQPHQKAA